VGCLARVLTEPARPVPSTLQDILWTIRPDPRAGTITILDQTRLPHRREHVTIGDRDGVAQAIRTMQVRGAPLIGVTAAWGMALALRAEASDRALAEAAATLVAQRPTAVNLRWAVDRMVAAMAPVPEGERAERAWKLAQAITDEDARTNLALGDHGVGLLQAIAESRGSGRPVQVLTHCNAGWLATTAWGTATAPIYRATARDIPVHVWVSETRPRNQGAALTAWELAQAGVPHTIITDNAAGHLMRTGRVDLCVVGADRVSRTGDVINKVGTYLKALAARDTGVPMYAAFPASTIDWQLGRGAEAPIEEREGSELGRVQGRLGTRVVDVEIYPEGSATLNPAFDLTPADLFTGFLTERGSCAASAAGLRALFPDSP
jgi:methylthioribose-1-phosphate isomerase